VSVKWNPVFVVGTVRSGTSLLYTLLNQHSEIGLMFELDVWDFPESLQDLRFRGNWLERQEFYNHALSRHRLVLGHSLRGLENARTPEDLYRIFGEGKGASRWGEKSPFYGVHLEKLAKRYPGCSIILLWRDPVETYRSIVQAGQSSPYFHRPGMLSRLIRHNEQIVRQAAALRRAGVRIHPVTYSALVDQTEEVCRELCTFLGVEFEPKMLDLSGADFSSIYSGAHHEHLRRGVVTRRLSASRPLSSRVVSKLERFRTRWDRLNAGLFGWQTVPSPVQRPEPGLLERAYHNLAGAILCGGDDMKRSLFEFLPLTWLRTYRQTKTWLFAERPQLEAEQRSWLEQLRTHWVTVFASYTLLAGTVAADWISGPAISMGLFYLMPPGILALIVNRRWGTVSAILAAVVRSVFEVWNSANPHFGIVLWNTLMRFLMLQFIVLVAARIRCELNVPEPRQQPDAPAESQAAKLAAAAKKSTRSMKTGPLSPQL
jgi:hypothetical protein